MKGALIGLLLLAIAGTTCSEDLWGNVVCRDDGGATTTCYVDMFGRVVCK
jgi:hypothetical protein